MNCKNRLEKELNILMKKDYYGHAITRKEIMSKKTKATAFEKHYSDKPRKDQRKNLIKP